MFHCLITVQTAKDAPCLKKFLKQVFRPQNCTRPITRYLLEHKGNLPLQWVRESEATMPNYCKIENKKEPENQSKKRLRNLLEDSQNHQKAGLEPSRKFLKPDVIFSLAIQIGRPSRSVSILAVCVTSTVRRRERRIGFCLLLDDRGRQKIP